MFWLCRAAEFFDGVFGDLHSVELWVAWEVEEPDGDGGVERLCCFEFERDEVAGLCACAWLVCCGGTGGGGEYLGARFLVWSLVMSRCVMIVAGQASVAL